TCSSACSAICALADCPPPEARLPCRNLQAILRSSHVPASAPGQSPGRAETARRLAGVAQRGVACGQPDLHQRRLLDFPAERYASSDAGSWPTDRQSRAEPPGTELARSCPRPAGAVATL